MNQDCTNKIKLEFPDKSIKQFKKGVSSFEVAESISKSLSKKAICSIINNKITDLRDPINNNSSIEIITARDESREAKEILNHSVAHLMANAVYELYDNVMMAQGPADKNGFFYDFDININFGYEDLIQIEKKMLEISKRGTMIEKIIMNKDEALRLFASKNEKYKIHFINSINSDNLSIYKQGDFYDLCRGPHLMNLSFIKHFKLTKNSSSYWLGDKNNRSLQRIYGVSFFEKESLNQYLKQQEEIKNRNHIKIAKKMMLYHQQEEANGDFFWHEKGYKIYNIIKDFISKEIENDYLDVKTPQLLSSDLWKKSGHFDKYSDNMFFCGNKNIAPSLNLKEEIKNILKQSSNLKKDLRSFIEKDLICESDHNDHALKPMSCPCHIEIYNKKNPSYKDLPIRISEYGLCHRKESSGSYYGLMRVKSFVQDDGHIFCQKSQVLEETIKFYKSLMKIYNKFGFNEVKIKLSTRPEKRSGSDEIWDMAEKSLQDALNEIKANYTIMKGEGAFYGPKIEFVLIDSLGRDWQCGTLQLDFVLPERLSAFYVDKDGKKKHPVIIHRAILGSFERFIGILIEHYAGSFPFWLAPVQFAICPISEKFNDYAKKINTEIKNLNFRTTLDLSSEKISYKIKMHNDINKPNYIVIIGNEELKSKSITLRKRGTNENISLSIDKLTKFINDENQ